MWLLIEGGEYLRAAYIQRNMVVPFLSTDSMGACCSTSNQLLDVHEQVICLHTIICYNDKSTDGVTFSIKLGITNVRSMLIVYGSHGIPW